MKITFVYTTPPYPPNAGGPIVDYNLLRGLAQRGHQLTAISLLDHRTPEQEVERIQYALEPICDFRAVREDLRLRPLKRAPLLLARMPATMLKYHSRALIAEVDRSLNKGRIDLLVLNMLHVAYLARFMQGRVPIVLLRHNVQSTIARRLLQTTSNPLLRLLLWREARRLSRYEAEACKRADLCCTLSTIDAASLRALNPALKPEVLPPPLDLENYRTLCPQNAPAVITFVGGYDWRPNADAAEWFCEKVFPRIHEREPRAELQLIGRHPTVKLCNLSAANASVTVPGGVTDLMPYLERTAVFVAPLRAGSGIRIKILEAMAWGIPVVSTSVGCEGIGAMDGRELFIADSEVAFADAVLRLLQDPQLRQRVGEDGREWVSRHHSLPDVIDRAEELFAKVVRQGPSHGKPGAVAFDVTIRTVAENVHPV